MSMIPTIIPIPGNPDDEKITESEVFARIGQYYAGDLHVHNTYSLRDGHNESVLNPDVVARYAGITGLKFIAPSNHTSNPGSPRPVSPDNDEVSDSLQVEYLNNEKIAPKRSARILNSLEANIFVSADGRYTIDIPDETLGIADVAFASIHAIEGVNKRDPNVMKALLQVGLRNPYVEIGHPYRHLEMWDHDWDYFRKHMAAADPESPLVAAINKIQQGAKKSDELAKSNLHKVIGKAVLDGTEPHEIIELANAFSQLSADYWEAWDSILDEYVSYHKSFEINLNAFDPNGSFYQKLLAKVAERDIPIIISTDFHNKKTFTDIRSGSLRNELPASLQGAASAKMMRRMLDLIDLLEGTGIPPERVINSSVDNLEEYRKTRNMRIGMHVIH